MFSSLRLNYRQAAKRSLAIAKPHGRTPCTRYSNHTIRTMASNSSSSAINGPRRAGPFFDLIKERRSHYLLNKKLTISKDRLQEIVKTALEWVPSPFDAQGTRVAVLFGEHHTKFWDIVTEVLKAIVPPEDWERTGQRMANFQNGAATVLFFEDEIVLKSLEKKYALYSSKMNGFLTQSDAMVQFAIWVALAAEGLGANLQHYNPIIDDKVNAHFNFPKHWKLNAQLVVGGHQGGLPPKTFMPIEERYMVFGGDDA